MSSQEPATVLIAEDSLAIRNILAFLLRGRGYRVLEAVDGNDALDRARAEPPDVLLLDVMMPGQTGFDVCQALKADPATRGIQVMILTGVTDGAGKSDDYWRELSGADDFMTKPFKAAEIVARIAKLVARSRDLKPTTDTV